MTRCIHTTRFIIILTCPICIVQAPTAPVSTDQSSADGQSKRADRNNRSRQPSQSQLLSTQAQQNVACQEPSRHERAPSGRSLRTRRPRQKPESPHQQPPRPARRRPAAAKAGKRKLEPEAAELSSDEALPVRKVPGSMRQTVVAIKQAQPGVGSAPRASQAAAGRRAQSQADFETIVCVSTAADVGDQLNGPTPGKRKTRRKPQPLQRHQS